VDFDFIRQGTHYNVHTAIGAGLADVQVTAHELVPVDGDAPIDNSEEADEVAA
jgi:hypothetical protein